MSHRTVLITWTASRFPATPNSTTESKKRPRKFPRNKKSKKRKTYLSEKRTSLKSKGILFKITWITRLTSLEKRRIENTRLTQMKRSTYSYINNPGENIKFFPAWRMKISSSWPKNTSSKKNSMILKERRKAFMKSTESNLRSESSHRSILIIGSLLLDAKLARSLKL